MKCFEAHAPRPQPTPTGVVRRKEGAEEAVA
jgi:hypothetical protein